MVKCVRESTLDVEEPDPIQMVVSDSTWNTPELPQNFFVTGYSPDIEGFQSIHSPMVATPPGIARHSEIPPVKNTGPFVPLRIQQIARVVTVVHPPRKTIKVGVTHPPNQNPQSGVLPSIKRTQNVQFDDLHGSVEPHASLHTAFAPPPPQYTSRMPSRPPPQYTSGMPPRRPRPPSSNQTPRAPVDPLLHTSIVTPPFPILLGENITPLEQCCYSHKSDLPDYLVPKIKMIFSDFEDGKKFYNRYMPGMLVLELRLDSTTVKTDTFTAPGKGSTRALLRRLISSVIKPQRDVAALLL